MGWTAQQIRVWMVKDRQGEWGEKGEGLRQDVEPPTDDDARELRMDRVAVLYGEITAATRAFLAAVAECDRHRDWEHAGFGSCAEWLAWRIGVTRNTANEKVRVARALEELPLTSEAMARGELSYSKVRALTRAAKPDTEAELVELARAGSAANLERVFRGWRSLDREDEARRERALHRSRHFSIFPGPDGMYVAKGRLTPEVAAVVMRAVEAASDALFQEAHKGEGEAPDPAQLRADALGLVAQRALAAGFQGPDAPVSGSRAERYQVMLHVEEATLQEDTGAPRKAGSGLSELEDGTRVTAETARRLSCDAARVTVRTNADGTIIDAGRRTRTIPPATRRALEARDRGCRFPGCGLRFTDGHHIVHWADGGPTDLKNLVLLCQRHHRRVHEGRYQVCSGADGKIVFFTPRGKALYEVPPTPELAADPLQELVQGNRDRGVVPDAWAATPRWHRDGDIPWAIEAAAREALDPWDDEGEVAEREATRLGENETREPVSGETSDPPDPITAETDAGHPAGSTLELKQLKKLKQGARP
jgi:hypothetical protein